MPNADSWCFTVQTTDDTIQQRKDELQQLSTNAVVRYLVHGTEHAPTTGRLHLQCYIRFHTRLSFRDVRALLPQSHIERAKGTAVQNATYCKKENDFTEYGETPNEARKGKRTDWEQYTAWCRSLPSEPSDRDIIEAFPSLFGRYRQSCRVIARELAPAPSLRDGPLRGWQQTLLERLDGDPDDRTVEFFVDSDGGSGKSWFCGWLLTNRPNVQILGPGKRDDLAHMVDIHTRIFCFNIPRGSMDNLQYSLLEMMKDRMVSSPKYESSMKIMKTLPHVVIFSNEAPDYSKMSNDRYKVTNLS